jgi:hypothetical protein
MILPVVGLGCCIRDRAVEDLQHPQ